LVRLPAGDQRHKANPGSTIVLAPLAGLATQIDKVDPGFAKDWQLSQTPKVVRFQQTNLYQTMAPAVRQLFDANIAGPRNRPPPRSNRTATPPTTPASGANTSKAPGMQSWLNDPAQAPLKEELALYGPNFLQPS
jgi:hypothetical protein